VDAERALADLLEISRDVEAAAVLDRDWAVVASNLDRGGSEAFAGHVAELVREAERVKPGADGAATSLHASTDAGSIFVVRDREHAIAATAPRAAAAALVLHDLRTCLREVAARERVEEAADAPA
jgi:predicted regulator of Ras-like GTPase activity (Roadblock/LC7/MglB family)